MERKDDVTTHTSEDQDTGILPYGLELNEDRSCRQDDCVICLSPITERAVAVPCDHLTFDFLCLFSWLEQRACCPLCNTKVTEVQYDWRSPTDFKTFEITSSQKQPESQPAQSSLRGRTRGRHPWRLNRVRWDRDDGQNDVDSVLERRRHVYRRNLYSLHVGSNRISRYTNMTPALFAQTPELQTRARLWIRRELRVFRFLDPDAASDGSHTRVNNIEFLLSYIVAILKSVEIKGSSGQAEEMLQEFLGREKASLFLHELNAWLRSPFTRLEDWDRAVQYREVLPNFSRDRRKYSGTSARFGSAAASSSRGSGQGSEQ